MGEKLITLETLEEITGITKNTLRTYLCGYRFNQFAKYEKVNGNNCKRVYCFNKDFLDTFTEFLWLKRKLGAIKCLEHYYKKEVRCNYD
jgi:hypothetical protein